MSRATPLTRHGAHRGRRSALSALMPSLLAVAAVASLITALAVWRGEEPAQPGALASDTRRSASMETVTALSDTPTPTPSATPTPTPSATPTPSESSAPVAETFDTEVVVLNQTSRGGLAGAVADRLRAAGWTVPAVGNFRGTVPATTVYYPDGEEAAAAAVAADLPTEPRVRPRFGNLSTTRLTVVVTDSYPG